jgi:formylglycine-generating enzyme required for sulfatase activity
LRIDEETTVDCGGGVTMKFVLIPAGKFMMGSPIDEQGRNEHEGTCQEITIDKPFYLAVCEVTQEQYEQVMEENPSYFGDTSKRPVDSVTWSKATAFCNRLSHETNRKMRLPTEAEWEYACRAGSATRFCYGDDLDESSFGEYAWYNGNSGGRSQLVGRKSPNAWGLYDMHGNVREWCGNLYADDPYVNVEELKIGEPTRDECRVLRGGSWGYPPDDCRSARRWAFLPNIPGGVDIGFRVVLEVE